MGWGQTVTRGQRWTPERAVDVVGWNPLLAAPTDAAYEAELTLFDEAAKTRVFGLVQRRTPPARAARWEPAALPDGTGYRVAAGRVLTLRLRIGTPKPGLLARTSGADRYGPRLKVELLVGHRGLPSCGEPMSLEVDTTLQEELLRGLPVCCRPLEIYVRARPGEVSLSTTAGAGLARRRPARQDAARRASSNTAAKWAAGRPRRRRAAPSCELPLRLIAPRPRITGTMSRMRRQSRR